MHEGDAPSVEHISLDSRKMTGNDLFVPIIGERADGHDYICMAIGNGAKAVFTSRHKTEEEVQEAIFTSAKGTKKKKQRQKQRHGSVCLYKKGASGSGSILQKHASSSFGRYYRKRGKDYHP